jgi:ABC-type nickel/cobalt efflux system permease component RcnA
LPIVLFGAYLPQGVQSAAEVAVGLMIMFLAARLLVRWRAGRFHAHVHSHGAVEHRHLHPHDHAAGHDHSHEPEARLGRSPAGAFAIGLMHGTGGSAGVAVLLLATIPNRPVALAALGVLAAGTALSMAAMSTAFGFAITRGPAMARVLALAPAMGILSLGFGGWYALGAIGVLPYSL